MITFPEEIKQGRRWIDREIQRLDPETDYARIMSMVPQYQMDEFTLNFLVTLLNSYVVKPLDFDKFMDLMENLGLYWLSWNYHL